MTGPRELSVAWLPLLTFLLHVTCLHGYAEGPPLTACTTMQPGTQSGILGIEGHVNSAKNLLPGHYGIAPYYILPYGHEFSSGREIHVGIIANQSTGPQYYKGVLMQARKVICASDGQVQVEPEALGTFTLNTAALLKTLKCDKIDGSAVSHKTRQFKVNETVTWRAPDIAGHVVFKATIVKDIDTYWMDVHSPIMHSPGLGPPPACTGCSHNVAAAILIPIIMALYNMINV